MSDAATNIEATAFTPAATAAAGPEAGDTALIRAALHLENLKSQTGVLALVLLTAPRNQQAVERGLLEVQTTLHAAWDAYAVYSAARTCVGSA